MNELISYLNLEGWCILSAGPGDEGGGGDPGDGGGGGGGGAGGGRHRNGDSASRSQHLDT